jgi:hypothetical protein
VVALNENRTLEIFAYGSGKYTGGELTGRLPGVTYLGTGYFEDKGTDIILESCSEDSSGYLVRYAADINGRYGDTVVKAFSGSVIEPLNTGGIDTLAVSHFADNPLVFLAHMPIGTENG